MKKTSEKTLAHISSTWGLDVPATYGCPKSIMAHFAHHLEKKRENIITFLYNDFFI